VTVVDTNVLVRFLVDDDPDQAARAASLFTRASAEGERLWERSRLAGAKRVVTFDRRLLRSPEFVEV
jgi:predicted nucleic-acid-binding protein